MGAKNVGHLVNLQELVYYAGSKCIARPSIAAGLAEGARKQLTANRGDIAKSSFSGSGSDQTRSAIGPSCGISARTVNREMSRRDYPDHGSDPPL
jgi:hypothetical protein